MTTLKPCSSNLDALRASAALPIQSESSTTHRTKYSSLRLRAARDYFLVPHALATAQTRATRAAALPFGFFGAAARAATFAECFRELAKLDRRFVDVGQLLHDRVCLSRHFAQKVEEQPLAVEEVFDVDQHSRDLVLLEQPAASSECVVAVLFQPGGKQVVFHGHAAEDLTVADIA